MSVEVTVSADGQQATISVTGDFDFDLYDEFRAAYAQTAGTGVHYRVDLTATEHLDSSALGMLMLLREHAGEGIADIEIIGASPGVRRFLDVANFTRLFTCDWDDS